MILKREPLDMTESLFEAVNTQQIRLLNHFLKQHGEQSANRGDLNFWLKQEGKIIAVARLIPVTDSETSFWLRGLFVVEARRKQGIGQQFMQQVHRYLQNTLAHKSTEKRSIKSQQACLFSIIAFPHGHLAPFYRPLGYQAVQPEVLPKSLKTRYDQAINANKDWLCMVYHNNE